MSGVWHWAADGVVLVHYAFLVYVMVGGFLAWRWPWTIWLHALAAIWAVLIVTAHLDCPLTALQNALREQAGQPALRTGFIDTYVRGTFFPTHQRAAAQAALGVVVLASWVGFGIRQRRRHRQRRTSRQRRTEAARSCRTGHWSPPGCRRCCSSAAGSSPMPSSRRPTVRCGKR